MGAARSLLFLVGPFGAQPMHLRTKCGPRSQRYDVLVHLGDIDYRHKKAGVTFIDLVSADRVQAGLFDRPDDARSIARMTAIDALNARYGRGAVAFGTAGERQGLGIAAGIHFATLYDGLGRAAAGLN
jgi:hypothetical protein